jgi:hypothetical protein
MQIVPKIVAAVAFILAAVCAHSSRAASPSEDEAFQEQIFGHVLGKTNAHACFQRVYDAPHLAKHPEQNVRTMRLLVTGHSDDPTNPSYSLGVGVTFRKSGTHFETGGDCGSIHGAGPKPHVVHCGVECDGGTIDVRLKTAKSVLVSIPEGARVWKAGSDGDDDDGHKRFGADDKIFRLDRTSLADCLSLASGEAEKAAIGQGQ